MLEADERPLARRKPPAAQTHAWSSAHARGILALRLAATQTTRVELGDRERAILDFERTWWQDEGSKETLIRRRLQLSPSRYYQVLHTLLEIPGALAYDPLVVHRLRRARRLRRQTKIDGSRASVRPRR